MQRIHVSIQATQQLKKWCDDTNVDEDLPFFIYILLPMYMTISTVMLS